MAGARGVSQKIRGNVKDTRDVVSAKEVGRVQSVYEIVTTEPEVRNAQRQSLLDTIKRADLDSGIIDRFAINENFGSLLNNLGRVQSPDIGTKLAGVAGLLALTDKVSATSVMGGALKNVAPILGAFQVGSVVGNLVNDKFLGTLLGGLSGYSAASFFASAAWAGPAGGLVGAVGALMSVFSNDDAEEERREAVRKAIKEGEKALHDLDDVRSQQEEGMGAFLTQAEMAIHSVEGNIRDIEKQEKVLAGIRDQNTKTISLNIDQLGRVTNVKNEQILKETKKILGKQLVQLGSRGVSDAGSGWFITAETEDVALKAQQELLLDYKAEMAKQEILFQNLELQYEGDMNNLDSARRVSQEQILSYQEKIRSTSVINEINMRMIDREEKHLTEQLTDLSKSIGKGKDSFWHAVGSTNKGIKQSEQGYKIANLRDLGRSVQETKTAQNPFGQFMDIQY